MTFKIKVFSDYVCPFCFLAEKPLKEAIKGKVVEIEWMPFELRPYPNETLLPEGHYLQNTWKKSVYPMAEKMGVEIVLPKVSPQPHTHLAFEGYQYAKQQGKGAEYHDRMMRAFFQEEQDIGNLNVLTKLAGEMGLGEAEFREVIVKRKFKEAHQKALNYAYHEVGVKAVPTFIIGKQKISGLRSKEEFEQIIENELQQMEQEIRIEGTSCNAEGCDLK